MAEDGEVYFFRGGLFWGVCFCGESVSLEGGVGNSIVQFCFFCLRFSLRLVGVAITVPVSSSSVEACALTFFGSESAGFGATGAGVCTCARVGAFVLPICWMFKLNRV